MNVLIVPCVAVDMDPMGGFAHQDVITPGSSGG